jgi:peroxiredoxin Q/BCP
MAQLRQDYQEFVKRDAEVVVVGPEGAEPFAEFWSREELPFVGLPDPKRTVLKLYGQQIKVLKLGRMPAQVLVDGDGTARYVHYGNSMSDIPSNEEILGLLDEFNRERL